MARYLLDSNIYVRAKETPENLGKEALEAIVNPLNRLFVSVATLWELAIKSAKGKLPFYDRLLAGGADAIRTSLEESGFQLLAIELHHTVAAAQLPRHHGDPFDRMIAAQAIAEGLTLITTDKKLGGYAGLNVLLS